VKSYFIEWFPRCDRKHTIKTGLSGPRPRRMTSGQGKHQEI
jgi:hypothetical protein